MTGCVQMCPCGERMLLCGSSVSRPCSCHPFGDASTSGEPRFAPLMLDEAFSKSDETFSAQALAAFHEFGFQLIMVAPIRMAGILEPFIGQAILVEKREVPGGIASAAGAATFGELAARREAEDAGA